MNLILNIIIAAGIVVLATTAVLMATTMDLCDCECVEVRR